MTDKYNNYYLDDKENRLIRKTDVPFRDTTADSIKYRDIVSIEKESFIPPSLSDLAPPFIFYLIGVIYLFGTIAKFIGVLPTDLGSLFGFETLPVLLVILASIIFLDRLRKLRGYRVVGRNKSYHINARGNAGKRFMNTLAKRAGTAPALDEQEIDSHSADTNRSVLTHPLFTVFFFIVVIYGLFIVNIYTMNANLPIAGRSAEPIKQDTLTAINEIEDYEFEASQRFVIRGQEQHLSMEGQVDLSSRRLVANIQPGGREYHIGNTLYIFNSGSLQQQETLAPSQNQRLWKARNLIDLKERILNMSEAEFIRDDSLDGEPVYVLELQPDKDQYAQLNEDLLNVYLESLQGVSVDVEINDATIRYWISRENNMPLKSTENVSMTLTGVRSIDVTTNSTTRITSVNDGVSINRPV